MKKINSLICIALAGLTTVSCEDFLTLMPLNDIVLENFWTDKSDVESVLLGAYSALEKSDCVVRMGIWGEMRSDNVKAGKNTSDDILQITRDNILETNSYTTYKCFYDVINRANTVLHFAPIVAAEDPNYTGAELQANEAEAIALRSLSYWYLIRAYKDVPYTTIPSIDDTHDFFIPQTSFDEILDSLIYDLERVKKYAVNKYPTENANTARFTRAAIYAMLADMYLWKGDYDKCIEACEWVSERKRFEMLELIDKQGTDCTIRLFPGELDGSLYDASDPTYPLITETPVGKEAGNAYNENFGTGNSFEILFELPYDQTTSNPFVGTYYNDKNSTIGQLKALPEIGNGFGNGGVNKVFLSPTDGRYYQNINSDGTGDYGIMKYVYQTIRYDLSSGVITGTKTTEKRNNAEPNWVIYRYTDVLLMEAEAKTMKAAALGEDPSLAPERNQLLAEAFKLVDAVNQRAICKRQYGDMATELKASTYATSVENMENLVLDERRRELMFEGKRWFDLVRQARRDGNTRRLLQRLSASEKFESSVKSAVTIKLSDMNALYFPLNKDEIKINTLLKQNPVYIEDEFIQKAK